MRAQNLLRGAALRSKLGLVIATGLVVAIAVPVVLLAVLATQGALSISLSRGLPTPAPEVVARLVPTPPPPPIVEPALIVPEPSITEPQPVPAEAGAPAALPTLQLEQPAAASAPQPPPDAPDPVPVGARVPPRTSARVGCNRRVVHVVRSGENLFRIALRYNTTIATLMRLNGISDPRTLRVGQRLTVITCAGQRSSRVRTYVVQPGDTLFRIALRYGTTVEALRAANGLCSNLIVPGQVLRIP